MNLSCSTATLISLRLRVSYASDPLLLVSKTGTRARIPQVNLTILYVEDDMVISALVADMLCGEGFRVETCADGLAALALIEGGGHYDLIMLDNELPHVNGEELARRARQTAHRRRTPIVMLSASEVRREAREAGADLFLRKPQDMGLLVRAVEALVGR